MTALIRSLRATPVGPEPEAEPKHARRPRLRDASEIAPRRRRGHLVPFLVVLFVASLFGILFVHIQAARSAFELQQLEQSARAKQERNEKLSVVQAFLEAPDRIRREALGRLKMREPQTVHYMPSEEVSGPGNTPAVPDTKPERRPLTQD